MIYEITYQENECRLPLRLRLIGENHLQEPVERGHGMPFFQWFYCTQGEGEFIVNRQRSVISKGQGLLIYPDLGHSYRAITKNWTMDFFAFDGTAGHEIVQALGMGESGGYHFADKAFFSDRIGDFAKEYRAGGSDKTFSVMCYGLLLEISAQISRIMDSQMAGENRLVYSVVSYMEEHYDRAIALDDLCRYAGYSREYLCASFRRSMGQTIMSYLRLIRISRSKIFLIQFPDKAVYEIADMCGFESASYFCKIFKKEVGVTPEQYRRGVTPDIKPGL